VRRVALATVNLNNVYHSYLLAGDGRLARFSARSGISGAFRLFRAKSSPGVLAGAIFVPILSVIKLKSGCQEWRDKCRSPRLCYTPVCKLQCSDDPLGVAVPFGRFLPQ
jgi:hypothetical protein